jgi:hypothetical protein
MKRLAILIIAFFLSASGAAQQKKLEETLIATEKRSWEAWQKRDGRFFDAFLSDDHVEVGPTGTSGKAGIVAFVGSQACKVASYKVDNFKVSIFGEDTALVTYRADQDTVCNGNKVPTPVWVSSLYIRRDGQWQNAMYQRSAAAK